MFRGRIGTTGLKQVENQMKPNKCDFCTLLIMLYFCTENERNLFSIENRPVGFYTECLLILDLRHVNKGLVKQRAKYEDWKVALAYFAKDSYMFSFDLKSGYHHVEISQEHQTFLGFSWRTPGSGGEVFYVFTVLPFGLSTAPYLFTKLLNP